MPVPTGIVQILTAPGTFTSTEVFPPSALVIDATHASFILQVTAASGTSPTLNVRLQTSPDGGTTWIDFVSFFQVIGLSTQWMPWSIINIRNNVANTISTGNNVLAAGAAIDAPIVPNLVRISIVIGGTTPSFTFSVTAILN